VELKEGRNRQIRRVAELLGHPVIDLQRVAIDDIQLDEWAHIVDDSVSRSVGQS
jgi:16S rRNA U516 pseudouridylate synthase RsuA-like enzyme